jgi:hypothetical protein
MTISNRLRAIRNAAKMRARGYRNSGNKTPNGLTIWTKTVNGVTKRKTANSTTVKNGRTTNVNNGPPNRPIYYQNGAWYA